METPEVAWHLTSSIGNSRVALVFVLVQHAVAGLGFAGQLIGTGLVRLGCLALVAPKAIRWEHLTVAAFRLAGGTCLTGTGCDFIRSQVSVAASS